MPSNLPETNVVIAVRSVLGKQIRTTRAYFERIRTIKHPELRESLEEVLTTFVRPEEISHAGQDIYLYYRRLGRYWLVAVARHLNGDGFLITAYKTSKKKRKGRIIWLKKR